MAPPLAYAFLALGDDDAPADQRTLPRVVVAAVAAVTLAVSTPLAFVVDQPVALLGSKSALVQDEE